MPNPTRARGLGGADSGCKPEAPSNEESFDKCGLWLLKESSDAKSALQEEDFLETLSEVFQQNETAAVAILAEAAPLTWIMVTVCSDISHPCTWSSSTSTNRSCTPTRITGVPCAKHASSWNLSQEAKESRRQQLEDATFDNEFVRLRSSVPAEWETLIANRGSVMFSVQRAARERLSLRGSLRHLKQRASQTWFSNMTWGSGRSRPGSRPEGGESFNQRSTSNSSMALRRCRRCTCSRSPVLEHPPRFQIRTSKSHR